MKKFRPNPALLLLAAFALPLPVLAAGGKSSKQHEQARTTKQAAEETARIEAAAAVGTGKPKPAEEKKVWTRQVRHKQTMPPAPNFRGTDETKKGK
jgi:hypothetical protein